MLLALNENNKLIKATDKKQNAKCPNCNSEMGSYISSFNEDNHWFHRPGSVCIGEKEPKTEWHFDNQNLFQDYDLEKTFLKGGISKRADVMINDNLVIEFQHSSITEDEILQRNQHYGKVVWVFDANEPYTNERLKIWESGEFEWIKPRKTIISSNMPVFLSIGTGFYHFHVITKDYKYTDEGFEGMHSFYYGRGKIYNREQFKTLILKADKIYRHISLPINFERIPDNYQTSLF
jgi:competence protein CoiA